MQTVKSDLTCFRLLLWVPVLLIKIDTDLSSLVLWTCLLVHAITTLVGTNIEDPPLTQTASCSHHENPSLAANGK